MGSALETPPGGGHVGWVAHRKSASSRAPGAGRYDKQGERLLMSTLTARGAGLDGEAGAASVAAIASVLETNRSRRPNEGVGSNHGVASHQRLGGWRIGIIMTGSQRPAQTATAPASER